HGFFHVQRTGNSTFPRNRHSRDPRITIHLHPMKPLCHLLAFTGMLCAPLAAQSDSSPASSNVGNEQFPRISKDLSVTFRLKAPEAKKVQVRGGSGLVKDAF